MDNDLIFLSGVDIPFPEAQVVLHQPTIKEISYIGEQAFYTGIEFLRFSKNSLNEEDRNRLENLTDFDILMSIMKDKSAIVQQNKACMEMVLSLIFPDYIISLDKSIVLTKGKEKYEINSKNFQNFQDIVFKMFSLENVGFNKNYNPSGKMAQSIAKKIRQGIEERNKRKQQMSESEKKIDIFSRYVSILAVGEHKDLNSLMNYTVYQLFDEFRRYELKASYDLYFEAKMAGAQNLTEPKNWMERLSSMEDEN